MHILDLFVDILIERIKLKNCIYIAALLYPDRE